MESWQKWNVGKILKRASEKNLNESREEFLTEF